MSDLDQFVGMDLAYHGANESTYRFKLGAQVFEMITCGDDYREEMARVDAVEPHKDDNFSETPLVTVRVVDVKRPWQRTENDDVTNVDSGYMLQDGAGHVWLTFGTDNKDDYYPNAVFAVTPKKERPETTNLDEVIKGITEHHKENPKHGTNCACMDKYIFELRKLLKVEDVAVQRRIEYCIEVALRM